MRKNLVANKNFRSQFSYSYSAKVVTLRAQVNIGASGAPTIASGTGMAIKSITRTGVGRYSILLDASYSALLGVTASIESGTSAPAAPSLNIVSQAVSTLAAPIVVIQMRDIAGAAADPASGEIIHLAVELHDSITGY